MNTAPTDRAEQVAAWVEAACILEVSVPKLGNVHPGASFRDVSFDDFVASARAIRPAFERAEESSIGRIVLSAARATAEVVQTNTNLGMILLLAPLAKWALGGSERLSADSRGIEAERGRLRDLLAATTLEDAELVYEAIRLARPGGLGRVEEGDVRSAPTSTLREAMVLAADRDLVAQQYTNSFEEVLDPGYRAIQEALGRGWSRELAVAYSHTRLLAAFPDSLIARKRGADVAAEASRRAAGVIAAGWPMSAAARHEWSETDAWLREDGHARNPGATADLTAASLFLAMWTGIL